MYIIFQRIVLNLILWYFNILKFQETKLQQEIQKMEQISSKNPFGTHISKLGSQFLNGYRWRDYLLFLAFFRKINKSRQRHVHVLPCTMQIDYGNLFSEFVFGYIMARTYYISMRWPWWLLCTKPICLVGFLLC
jgi:hypothetical protein